MERLQHPRMRAFSGVEFLGAMCDFLHSRARLPLIPPTSFPHEEFKGGQNI